MYINSFIAVVKCNGKIMREVDKDIIQLPFGSEYSLLFKNLKSQRAIISISIDGKDVMDGNKLVIDANSKMELERFVTNDDNQGNRFKFIQKTDKIVNHRGDRIDDGIIRIEFAFEQEPPQISYTYNYTEPIWVEPWYYRTSDYLCGSVNEGNSQVFNSSTSCNYSNSTAPKLKSSYASVNEMDNSLVELNNNEGITVPGSISNQSFRNVSTRTLGESTVMTFKLQGVNSSDIIVTKPLTVKTKVECDICGTKNKSNHKFCTDCGASLI